MSTRAVVEKIGNDPSVNSPKFRNRAYAKKTIGEDTPREKGK